MQLRDRAFSGLQKSWFHPKHHKNRGKKKSVTKKAAVNVRAALGEPRTAGKVEREPSQSSRHFENAFPTLSLHFLYSIGCYNLYK